MDPEHWQRVMDLERRTESTCLRAPSEAVAIRASSRAQCSLTRALYAMIDWGLNTGAPIAMPPDVGRVYISDPNAVAGDVCEACGYPSPVHQDQDGTLTQYFPRCPLCGGRTAVLVQP
jgi:hypothetical protein